VRHVTPLRLIAAGIALGAVGGLLALLTFSLPPKVAPAFFWTGNGVLVLAAIAASLGWGALVVEIGVRAALSGHDKTPRQPQGPTGDLVERGSGDARGLEVAPGPR
jgi:hypothetical protein